MRFCYRIASKLIVLKRERERERGNGGGSGGVRTRARALAMKTTSSGTVKRRKVDGGGSRFSPSLIHLRSRRRVVVTAENSVSPTVSVNSRRRSGSNYRCSSHSSDHFPISCCSSNGSSELDKERSTFADLEEQSAEIETSSYNFECRERRETTPSSELGAESGDMESTARPFETNSRRKLSPEKIPSESEIEAFFAAAEMDLQKQFTEKYNYDIVKDLPLEGRYEWVEQKP